MKKLLKLFTKNISLMLFLLLIYLPAGLFVLGKYKDRVFDVELQGYTDEVPSPELNIENIKTGKFQQDFTSWTDSNLPLRGVYVRTYNTINLKCFKVGNGDASSGVRYIGKDGYVFEEQYLYSQLSMNEWDYSDPERVQGTIDMVNHMVSIDNKLQKSGKRLYVYVVPGKPDLYSDYIPYKWQIMANEGSPRCVDVFRQYIEQTDIKCRFFGDMADDLGYPAYYQTGIHWSRPFEQTASQTIISDLCDLTGKNYRNIEFVDMETSKTPYYRDTDMYDLLNVWTYPDIDYYQYVTRAQEGEFEPLRILICGDSFTDGLLKDVTENIPEDAINFINRKNFWMDTIGNYMPIGGDYDLLNWQYMLDLSDVVVVEVVDVNLMRNGFGFLEYLDSYLDTYEAREIYECYTDGYDVTSNRNSYFATGFNGVEAEFTWTKEESSILLHVDPSQGLEVNYTVPLELFMAVDSATVSVYVNDVYMGERTYTEETDDTIVIPGESIERTPNDTYQIRLVCSEHFVPQAIGIGDDTRELALKIKYIGRAR